MKIFYLSLLLYIFIYINPQEAKSQDASVSFQVFYDELSPYGYWVVSSDYGFVWVPDVDPGFAPYETNGYWIYTDDGWTWVSNYPWGWAPFHYGRWYTDATYGPVWVPGNEWGPGWVTWRSSNDNYGWAPLGPGISLSIAFGSGYNEHYNHYTYVHGGYLGRRSMYKHYQHYSDNDAFFRNTIWINNVREHKNRNYKYHGGPDRSDVEKRSNRKIVPLPIKESRSPGQNVSKKQLEIYRPLVQSNVSTAQKPAPSKVSTFQNVKPLEQRKAEAPKQKAIKPVQQPNQQKNIRTSTPQIINQKQAIPSKKMDNVKKPQQVQPSQNQGKQGQQQHRNVQQPKQQPQVSPPKAKQPQQVQPTQNPGKQGQQQRNVQQPKQKQNQQQQASPPKKVEERKQSQQVQPSQNPGKQGQQQRNVQQPKQKQNQQQQRNAPQPKQQTSPPKVTQPPPQANPPQNPGREKKQLRYEQIAKQKPNLEKQANPSKRFEVKKQLEQDNPAPKYW